MTSAGERVGQASAETLARPRQVVVAGNRVRVVDMHAHCSVPEAAALMGIQSGLEGGFPALLMANYRTRVSAMDQQGIDVEALSINPYWYGADRDLASEVIRLQNEKLAEFCASEPERFVGLASVALQHPVTFEPAFQLGGPLGVNEDDDTKLLGPGPERVEAWVRQFFPRNAPTDQGTAEVVPLYALFQLLGREVWMLQGDRCEANKALGLGGAELRQLLVL